MAFLFVDLLHIYITYKLVKSVFPHIFNYFLNVSHMPAAGRIKVMPEPHLVPDAQGDDVRPWAVFERVGSLVHQDLLGSVGVFVRPRQQQIPLVHAHSLGFPAQAFKPVGLPHRVQFSFLDEIPDVIETWDGCVLE